MASQKRYQSDTDSTQWVENVAFTVVSGIQCSGVGGGGGKKKIFNPSKCSWLIGITKKNGGYAMHVEGKCHNDITDLGLPKR